MRSSSKVLIHHHAIAFIENERIWIQSFIGAWVQALSYYFDEIGLLVQVSNSRKSEQDYQITAENIKVHRLNLSYSCNRYQRNQYIRQVCKAVSSDYNSLLIRGITPRQKLIFDSCNIHSKFYLLVGSLIDSKPTLRLNKISIVNCLFFWFRRYELKKISKSAYMLANSPEITREIFAILGVNAKFVPTSSISNKDFFPLHIRFIERPIKILFCGRVVREKGIEELIEALKWLKNLDILAILDVVGNVSKNYQSILSRKIKKQALESQIRFHGFVPFGENLLQFYNNSDLYVLPSWHEGFPHSTWEAAATCTPVIITSVGGISGILNSDHVLFCEARSSHSIADAIVNCITNLTATRIRIVNLYHLALNFTVEKCAESTYNILSK